MCSGEDSGLFCSFPYRLLQGRKKHKYMKGSGIKTVGLIMSKTCKILTLTLQSKEFLLQGDQIYMHIVHLYASVHILGSFPL